MSSFIKHLILFDLVQFKIQETLISAWVGTIVKGQIYGIREGRKTGMATPARAGLDKASRTECSLAKTDPIFSWKWSETSFPWPFFLNLSCCCHSPPHQGVLNISRLLSWPCGLIFTGKGKLLSGTEQNEGKAWTTVWFSF